MERITYFKFEIGSYFGSNTSIEYRKHRLIYKFSDYPFEFMDDKVTVSEKMITEMELKPLNNMIDIIAGWEKYSHNTDILDGEEWSMKIRCGRKQVNRAGYCTETPEYKKMVRILQKLSGHHH